jgi:hypothetical protein
MKILGHKSPGMSMTYAHISDPTVLADYQAVLEPGAVIAGALADALRGGQLDQDALDWLKPTSTRPNSNSAAVFDRLKKALANATST